MPPEPLEGVGSRRSSRRMFEKGLGGGLTIAAELRGREPDRPAPRPVPGNTAGINYRCDTFP